MILDATNHTGKIGLFHMQYMLQGMWLPPNSYSNKEAGNEVLSLVCTKK